jgi:hypothetical protein
MWKDPKVREWKYLRSMREFTMRSLFCVYECFSHRKRIFSSEKVDCEEKEWQ